MTTPDLTPTPPADTTTPAGYDELVRYIAAEASHAPPQFAPAWADYLLAGYRMTPRATPPADTRQQAIRSRVIDALNAWPNRVWLRLPGPVDLVDQLADHLTTALASSSPAPPEPPAPVHARDHTQQVWCLPAFGTSVTVDPGDEKPQVDVYLGFQTLTLVEARLLASTLLAAADVAEEQQP